MAMGPMAPSSASCRATYASAVESEPPDTMSSTGVSAFASPRCSMQQARRREHVPGTRGRIGAEPGTACRGVLVPRSLLLCHFLPYLYIWLPLHALDERDGFDVVGVREHVHGLHRSHAVAELLEKAQVTDLRFRVA